MIGRILLAFMLVSVTLAPLAQPAPRAPAVALFYGASPPMDELAAFDAVVLEPDHAPKPLPAERRTAWFAYVSAGEVHSTRPYFGAIPPAWKLGSNPAFGSAVIDQAQPAWADFFCEAIVRPLWDRGFRGFFLDTLDSYHLVAKTDAERARQEAGLASVIVLLKQKFPGAKLMFNRGFEILPKVHGLAYAVAAESLYRSYDHGAKKYAEVPAADREWLTGQMKRVQGEYKLPAIFIDYVAAKDRELARATARRIAADGFIPWVTTPALDVLGVGAVEVMPRKILMLYEKLTKDDQLIYLDAHRVATMPLNYLGYTVEYIEASEGLPEYPLTGRVAGIVTRFTDNSRAEAKLYAWLKKQVDAGIRVAILGDLGFRMDARRAGELGLTLGAQQAALDPLRIGYRDPMIGFELEPFPDRRSYLPLTVAKGSAGTPLLTLVGRGTERMDAVALTSWGGYALHPYNVTTLPGTTSKRWIVDPFAFYQRTLALPAMPVPDVTTENGRRLLIAHIDGDGFASRAETPAAPYSGEVLLKEILERYRLPHTVSVIEGETSVRGLYPAQSAALEAIARRIFALDSVEIASHSFSHPFRWQAAETAAKDASAAETYSLKIPNYTYDTRVEVQGSISYINKVLAPKGKRVRVFLWTGDCNPDDEPLAQTEAAGVYNMNGGDTLITRADPSVTRVSPLGIPRGRFLQVYAPNQNENVYTNLWEGPYYGYERVIETFELTGSPRRLKPVNIYYHMYSTTKAASLAALHKVYRWALSQPLFAIHASEYVAKVNDFQRVVVAKAMDGSWLVRGTDALRTLRAPAALGVPSGDGVAGSLREGESTFVHLHADEARFGFAPGAANAPTLAEANARLTSFERTATGFSFGLAGHRPLEFRLAGAERCSADIGGRALAAGKDGLYHADRNGAERIDIRCR
jgi:hypothetical protein